MHAGLEHSSMKSFSLSSLGGTAPAAAPDTRYHSLHKKRKEAWRRSWGSGGSGGGGGGGGGTDDLWPLLQQDYDYIMDNHIINTCKEASGELRVPSPRPTSPPAATLAPHPRRHARARHRSERERDESGDSEPSATSQHETRRLRRWLHEMEGRLPPPSLPAARALSPRALRSRLRYYQVLQREVESEGRAVSSAARAGADSIQHRWQLLYLRTIDWQCHLEACIHTAQSACVEVCRESDSEPAHKLPRLSRGPPAPRTPHRTPHRTAPGSCQQRREHERRVEAAGRERDEAADMASSRDGDVVDGLETERTCSSQRSRFQQTERSAHNFATFYIQHHDTDTDLAPGDALNEKASSCEVEEQCERRAEEHQSEDEDVSGGGGGGERGESTERLVAEAERLVRGVRPSPRNMTRIAEWLRQNHPAPDQWEGYDASGEYTTESEVGAGSGGEEAGGELLAHTLTTLYSNKVVMRKKRCGAGGLRPWSVACDNQSAPPPPRPPLPLSTSESALHTLCGAVSSSSVTTAVQRGLVSSSTTVDETCVSVGAGGAGARRRRSRARAAPAPPPARRLVKSSSFCGALLPVGPPGDTSQRSAASDPANRAVSVSTSGVESGGDAGAGAGGAPLSSVAPLFRVGGACVSRGAGGAGGAGRPWQLAAQPDLDSDLERTTEELSSFSEQAWDSYQEKYNSEPYSEAQDYEGARRLIDFGDDYHAFLDLHSDNCSSVSRDPRDSHTHNPQRRSPGERSRRSVRSGARRRGGAAGGASGPVPPDVTLHTALAPDSDNEEASEVVRVSECRLRDARALLARADSAPDLLLHEHYNKIESQCRENESSLLGVVSSPAPLCPALLRRAAETLGGWSALRAAAERRGSARRVRRELAALPDALHDICKSVDTRPPLHNKQQLCRRIDLLKDRLSRLLDTNVLLLRLSVSLRRGAAAAGESDPACEDLAAQLAALLAQCDMYTNRATSELSCLERALSAWTEWEAGVSELTSALRSDTDALRNKSGSSCGSLSDSGISDGDSEAAAAAAAAACGARARRLAALRDLARDLQAALAPQSHAIRAIAKRMEQAESELRALHESCRAVTPPAGAVLPRARDGGGWTRVWRRALRSGLSVQLCLVAVLVAAWLLERPRCCHLVNTLADSLTPTLRYVRGPPPH